MNENTIIIDYNYLLKQNGDEWPYAWLNDAIVEGIKVSTPFTVNMVEPEMIVCFWQPGMAQVAYNEYYKAWYEAQQSGYESIAGQPAERRDDD